VASAANSASREHPCRVIVLARGQKKAAPRLDAQIRVGGDAGASDVIVLRGYGQLADDEAGAGMVMPLLLPDAPVVVWWPGEAPAVPSEDAVGKLAQRRITDALSAKNPTKAFEQRRAHHVAGDTDLTWTRLTPWRALLATALDAPPHDPVTGAVVAGEVVSPSTDLMAGWLAERLGVKVKRSPSKSGPGLGVVRLERQGGPVELVRPDGKVGKLSQPGQDKYVQQMFFDYQKCGTTHDTGVYIAGDCVSWTSGWVEGALTTGLNAAAGVFKSLRGTLNPDANGQTPLKIDAKRYTYF